MKEIEDDFLRGYFKSEGDVELPSGINERIIARLKSESLNRLAHYRLLVWSCVGSVIVAIAGLVWYLYYTGVIELGAVEFQALELRSMDVMWIFVGCIATVFMVLSLYLSRRLESGRV